MANKKSKREVITQARFERVIDLYFKWKDLNEGIKKEYPRGINLPEGITEPICCYVNGFELSTGGGSEDAVKLGTEELVQIKASSNFNSDLTSFGPKSKFDIVHFLRLNQDEDKIYLYDIPVEYINNMAVNSSETYEEQKKNKRRPRFSIINKIINPQNISHYAIVDLKNKEVIK